MTKGGAAGFACFRDSCR